MFTMYFVLQHPGFVQRAMVAGVVCAGAALLIAGRPPVPQLRFPLVAWGAALALLGLFALASPGDDAWASIAGVIFLIEGSLTVAACTRR